MAFADTLNKIVAPITNILATGFQTFANVSVAQSVIGINDAKKKEIYTGIDIASQQLVNNQAAADNVKKLNKLINKYNNAEYLTLEEYNFIIENGVAIPYSYNGYIEAISAPKQTDYLTSYSSSSQEVYQASSEKQINWKLYAAIGAGIFGVLYLIKR